MSRIFKPYFVLDGSYRVNIFEPNKFELITPCVANGYNMKPCKAISEPYKGINEYGEVMDFIDVLTPSVSTFRVMYNENWFDIEYCKNDIQRSKTFDAFFNRFGTVFNFGDI